MSDEEFVDMEMNLTTEMDLWVEFTCENGHVFRYEWSSTEELSNHGLRDMCITCPTCQTIHIPDMKVLDQ